jgi:hypothetical protein
VKDRIVKFYWLSAVKSDISDFETLDEILTYVMARKYKAYRKFDITNEKFCYLQIFSTKKTNPYMRIEMRSARSGLRPPVVDRNTLKERKNPRTLDEGDKVSTHMVCKNVNGNILLGLESSNDTLSIGQFIKYLERFATKLGKVNVRFTEDELVDQDFLKDVLAMKRAKQAVITVKKKVLGGDYLNYTNRTVQVRHNVDLVIKAELGDNIKNSIVDIFNSMNGGRNEIVKIEAEGFKENGSPLKVNTEQFGKKEKIKVDINATTGEVLSNSIFSGIQNLLASY